MSKLTVRKVPSIQERKLPIFDELEKVVDQIRVRAYNLFARRGFSMGNDLEDWLDAEREVCWPAAELVEEDDEFEVKVALAGFDAKDISVTATPRELIVKAARSESHAERESAKVRWSQFSSNDVYRYIELPADINVDKITAEYKNGVLEIEAPKSKKKAKTKTGKGRKKSVKISS